MVVKVYGKNAKASQVVTRDPGFKIFITNECYAKIVTAYLAVETEVGALVACYNEGKNFFVTDIYITEQTVTSADVDFTQEGIDSALFKAVEDDVMIGGWIHSHADMSAFWSTTDEASIKKLREYTGAWLLSIVGNRSIDLLGRIDYKETSAFGDDYVYVDDVPIIIIPEVSDELRSQIVQEIEDKVTVKKYVANNYYGTCGSKYSASYKSYSDIDKDKSLDDMSDEEYFAMLEEYGYGQLGIDTEESNSVDPENYTESSLLNVGI